MRSGLERARVVDASLGSGRLLPVGDVARVLEPAVGGPDAVHQALRAAEEDGVRHSRGYHRSRVGAAR